MARPKFLSNWIGLALSLLGLLIVAKDPLFPSRDLLLFLGAIGLVINIAVLHYSYKLKYER